MTHTVNKRAIAKVDRAPLRWLLPPRCVVCGGPGLPDRDLCQACQADLPSPRHACPRCALPQPRAGTCAGCTAEPPPLDAAHAAFAYAFPLDRLLPRLKFHRDFAAGRVLAHGMAERFAALPRPQALVPIPLHHARLRQRGYDQTLELARPLAKALRLPLHTDLLRRVRATRAQSRLDADARRQNLQDAFRVAPGVGKLPAYVVLLDDVMTTGATLHAAARALRVAGVTRVEAWVCARVA